jgi:hypothetical protein
MDCAITLSPKRITRLLLLSASGLILLGIAAGYARASLSEDYLYQMHLFGLAEKFDLDGEQNIQAWFQTALLLLCSILLWLIASAKRLVAESYLRHWQLLALIFLGLSLDEAASLHEMTVEPLRAALHTTGFLYFAWVILGATFVLLFGLAYLRFLFHLPARYRVLFLISGALFVSGAVGMEMVDGNYFVTHGRDLTYAMLTVGEEALEISGLLSFIYALLGYLSEQWSVVSISLQDGETRLANKPVPLSLGKRGTAC